MTQGDALQGAIRDKAAQLLESGAVKTFIGWEAGRFENQTTPLIIQDPAKAQKLVWNDYCVNTLGKYAKDFSQDGKVGMLVRGCDSRAIVRMVRDKVVKRDGLYLIGLGCPGMKDRKTDAMLDKCSSCTHHNPVDCDEMLGAQSDAQPAEGRFERVEQMEALPRESRQAYFASIYAKCIRCYACRDVCPCCTCRECFVDQRREAWVGKQNNIPENRFYGITRVMHVADRCIECGECERACPMGLPLMQLNRKVIKDMNELFGEYEAGVSHESGEALVAYSAGDREEFM